MVAKLVAGEAQDHQPMWIPALELVELGEVPGCGPSEGGHILDEHHPPPVDVEVYGVPLQGGGTQVIERLGDVRHAARLGTFNCRPVRLWRRSCRTCWSHDLGYNGAFVGCRVTDN